MWTLAYNNISTKKNPIDERTESVSSRPLPAPLQPHMDTGTDLGTRLLLFGFYSAIMVPLEYRKLKQTPREVLKPHKNPWNRTTTLFKQDIDKHFHPSFPSTLSLSYMTIYPPSIHVLIPYIVSQISFSLIQSPLSDTHC